MIGSHLHPNRVITEDVITFYLLRDINSESNVLALNRRNSLPRNARTSRQRCNHKDIIALWLGPTFFVEHRRRVDFRLFGLGYCVLGNLAGLGLSARFGTGKNFLLLIFESHFEGKN